MNKPFGRFTRRLILLLVSCCYFHLAQALPIADIEPSSSRKLIEKVSNHPYNTAVSADSSLAVVSGEDGASLINLNQLKIIQQLDIEGLAANAALFVKSGDAEMLYIMAFTNFLGGTKNGVYGFPIKDGKTGTRIDFLKAPGSLFPATSFSLAASQDGKSVFFVTLETDGGDGNKQYGKRWLQQITVDTTRSIFRSIEMPEWKGYSGDGGDYGVTVSNDGDIAYLAHSKGTYQVTGLNKSQPVVTTLSDLLEYNAALLAKNGEELIMFSYGDIDRFETKSWKKSSLYHQDEDRQSFIEGAMISTNQNQLLTTLQDISAVKAGHGKTLKPAQFYQEAQTELFPPNAVIAFNLTGNKPEKTTLYKRILSGPYPTSACWTPDGKSLLITLWNALKDTTSLAVYDMQGQNIQVEKLL